MFDSTPAPFGGVTRRFTHLDDGERDRHSSRRLDDHCASEQPAHVEARRGVSTERPPRREQEATVVRRP